MERQLIELITQNLNAVSPHSNPKPYETPLFIWLMSQCAQTGLNKVVVSPSSLPYGLKMSELDTIQTKNPQALHVEHLNNGACHVTINDLPEIFTPLRPTSIKNNAMSNKIAEIFAKHYNTLSTYEQGTEKAKILRYILREIERTATNPLTISTDWLQMNVAGFSTSYATIHKSLNDLEQTKVIRVIDKSGSYGNDERLTILLVDVPEASPEKYAQELEAANEKLTKELEAATAQVSDLTKRLDKITPELERLKEIEIKYNAIKSALV